MVDVIGGGYTGVDTSTDGGVVSKGAERPVIIVGFDDGGGIGSSPGAENEKAAVDSSAAIFALVAML